MSDRFIRVYKKLNLDEVKEHLLVCGALSAQCANCQETDISLNKFEITNPYLSDYFYDVIFEYKPIDGDGTPTFKIPLGLTIANILDLVLLMNTH